jgi:hypothetical protein
MPSPPVFRGEIVAVYSAVLRLRVCVTIGAVSEQRAVLVLAVGFAAVMLLAAQKPMTSSGAQWFLTGSGSDYE